MRALIMADKMRSVNTKFWDDCFIQDLNPTEKLLFLYLLTNPLTNLLGIYEITIKRISFDTGLNKEIILKGLERFGMVKKVFYINNYIVMPNFLKNQNLNTNMKIGVTNIFKALPNELKDSILSNGSETVSNDYKSILNSLLKYEIEIEKEDEKEDEDEKENKIESSLKFYTFEYELNKTDNHINGYLNLIKIIKGDNDLHIQLDNILKLRDQLRFSDFVKLRKEKNVTIQDIKDYMTGMENNPKKYLKDKLSLYRTILTWVKNDKK